METQVGYHYINVRGHVRLIMSCSRTLAPKTVLADDIQEVQDDIQEGSGSMSTVEVILTNEKPFVNRNDFNAIDRTRNWS